METETEEPESDRQLRLAEQRAANRRELEQMSVGERMQLMFAPIDTLPRSMSDPLVQIIATRPDGTDPRAASDMVPVREACEEMETLKKAKDYPGAAIRPRLVLWDTSGSVYEVEKTQIPAPATAPAPPTK